MQTASRSAATCALLAALSLCGCASTDAGKTGDGFHSLGQSPAAENSWSAKLTAPFKKSAALASSQDNRAATANDSDALSLSKKPDKNNPNLRVALAQMHERSGNLDKAEAEYKKALKLEPKHLDALMGYAHLQDRRNQLDEATKLYQKAIAAHPNEAGILNDLGLCMHRHGKLIEANSALKKAVALAPERKLYRNNLAALMVEQGMYDDAIDQLTVAHGQAAAHYNLGYLLTKKGNSELALHHFKQAATLDPSLDAARQWVAKLSPPQLNQPQPGAPTYTPPSSAVAQRYLPIQQPAVASQQVQPLPPQPGSSPVYLDSGTAGVAANDFSVAPAGVRYPDQQTSGYSGTAALPPNPQQYRQ
jgi:Flp pilus assembly protein TadD